MSNDGGPTPSVLHGLRDLGVHLTVDDFGTGASSLSYLRRFPIDRVKIDRSLVGRLGTNGDDSLVAATVAMASALELESVAEGVESDTQAEALRAAGCRLAQGYWFDRPMSADRITELLVRDRQRKVAETRRG